MKRAIFAAFAAAPLLAQAALPCGFDTTTLAFAGTPQTQARCLLRYVSRGGVIDAKPATLPPLLASLVGTTAPSVDFIRYAARKPASEIGGDLGQRLERVHYFVIHDTSTPWLGDAPAFPADDAPELNRIAHYAGPNAVAHVFVNRLGETVLGHDFAEPWRATKFETKVIGQPAKGLFVHIELMQPRRRDPQGSPKNDLIAPLPGFTPAQYEKLALLYAAASARAGRWLVPAFHADLDEGLDDAHDDPQHFEIDVFAAALQRLLDHIKEF